MKITAWWNEKSFLQKFFVLFLICSGILWTVVPATYHSTLPFDPPETLMWGSTFNLGNAKHPPMSGYMLFNFCRIFDFANFSIFLLSQICVTIGLVYIYKLSRCFFDRDESIIATLLITFYIFYNYETPKFNANTPHLLFIPMMCYYFFRGCTANKWHHWMLLAASAAGACLSKYSAGVIGLSFCMFLLMNKDSRKVLFSVKPYAAALFFAGLMTPHIIHLFETDFLVLDYINHGRKMKYGYWGQLLVQLLAIILPLVCMSFACFFTHCVGKRKLPRLNLSVTSTVAFQYSLCIIGGQALFQILMGVLGHRLQTVWTYPLYLTAGIFIMSFYPHPADERVKRWFAFLCSGFAAVLLLISLVYHHCRSSYRYHVSKAEIRAAAEGFYRKHTGADIPFISGDIWGTSILQNSCKYTVKAAPFFDKILLGLHSKTIADKGALLISRRSEVLNDDVRKNLGVELKWEKAEIPYSAIFGKEKKLKLYLAILPPSVIKKVTDK